MIAYDATSYSYIAGPMVVSEVTITRGWTETRSSVSSKTSARTRLSANDAPSYSHKPLTRFKTPEERTVVNATVTTSKFVEERFGYINKALEKRRQNN
jgi:predicted ATP-grasp superfamily ATP-dependent carboligase